MNDQSEDAQWEEALGHIRAQAEKDGTNAVGARTIWRIGQLALREAVKVCDSCTDDERTESQMKVAALEDKVSGLEASARKLEQMREAFLEWKENEDNFKTDHLDILFISRAVRILGDEP